MENKLKVYLETTIPGYLTGRPTNNLIVAGKQEITRRWWEMRRQCYQLVISAFVLDEAGRGDPSAATRRVECLDGLELLDPDEEVVGLTQAILGSGIIPPKAATDAAHIAIASRHGVDFLLTWNCTHIANAEILRKIQSVVENCGFSLPVICTPHELFGGTEYGE